MGKVIKPPMDHPNCKGLQDPFHSHTPLHAPTNPTTNDTGASLYNRTGDCKSAAKEGDQTDIQRNWLPQSDFCGPKEGWRLETSPRSQQPKSICQEYPLQDGIPDQPEGSDQPRGLSHKDRPQGCLPDGSSTQGIAILPQIQVEERHISVCNPPFRIGSSPIRIHEAPPASSSSFQEERGEDHDLHRRYPHPSIQPTSSIKTSCRSPGTPPEAGFHHQLGKVHPIATTNPGVPGNDGRHHPHGTETSTGQSGKSSKGVLNHNCEDHYHPQDVNETDWENDSHHSGSIGSTPPLQIPPGSYQPTPQPRNPLGREHYPHSSVQRGFKLVDASTSQSEWEETQKSHSKADIGNRRFQDGMGSDNRKERNIREVVPDGVTTTHKSTGVESNGSSTKDPLQTHVTLPHSHKERQSSGSEIHQYKGGNSLSDSEQGSDPDMDLVQAKKLDDPSRIFTRKPERVGRCRVEKESRNERLEIGSSHIPTIATSQRPTGDRLVRSKTQHTAGELLQLASRSRCTRDRRIQIQLDNTEGLCIPTILPRGQMSEKSDSRQSVEASSYSPSVATSSMVSSTSGFTGGTPCAANTSSDVASGSKGEHTSPPSSRQSAPSQLDCVVQQLDAKGVSKDAAELIQASWRKGTQKSYASAWGKWCGWCDRRETDPVSAPVKYLLDFITEEFKEGKQYSTLNTYRSAISATHVGYSGTPAGQHPLVCRLLQGIFNSRPPMPKNVILWDVEIALKHAESIFPLEELSLKQISERTAMLLALANADRVSDLHSLDLKFRSYRYGGVSFIIPTLTKTRRSGPPREVFYAQLEENTKLCPVTSLRAYEKKTEGLRQPDNNSLFISVKKPHLPVSSQTLSRWIKNFLSEAGIDTNQFTAHSTRGVATSTALALGVSLPEIMKAANWKRQSTFTRYYCRPTVDNKFSKTVLTALKVSIYFKRYTVICAALLRWRIVDLARNL